MVPLKRIIFCLSILLAGISMNGQVTLKDTVELQIRDGLPNFMAKAATGQAVRIGYIGGSITESEGWRVKSLSWFKEYFNNDNIIGYNAAVGGTNSKYGVFRIEEQMLNKYSFDLIFIEFAVNDLTLGSSEVGKCIEGMVRKIWKKNPGTDICIVHALREGTMFDDINSGKMPLTSTIHDNVAEYYGIPSIFWGVQVIKEIKEGTTVFMGNVVDQQQSKNAEGKYVFTVDGVHPTNYGQELYTNVTTKCIRLMENMNTPMAHTLKSAMIADNYQNATMSSYSLSSNHGFDEVTQTGNYTFLDEFITPENTFLIGEDQQAYYEFTYTGNMFGFSLLQGPGSGKTVIEVDGTKSTYNFFDAYCYSYRESSFFFNTGENTHKIKIYPGIPLTLQEKEQILVADKRSDIQKNPSKYQHNYFIFSKILVNGTLINDTPVQLVTGISVTGAGGSDTITNTGGTLQLSAGITPENASNKTVSWSVQNGTGEASISATGLLTAISDGTVTALATANDGSGVSGSLVVTISGQIVSVTGITVTGAGGVTTITSGGGTLQLSAAILPDNATNKTVTWSVQNGTGQASISPDGLLTAISDGTVIATATAIDGSDVSGSLSITIAQQPVEIASIVVYGEDSKTSITTPGGTLQLYTTIFPDNATNKTVIWSAENGTGQASIGSSGLLTAITDGDMTARATATDGSGISGILIITIENQSIQTNIDINNPDYLNIAISKSELKIQMNENSKYQYISLYSMLGNLILNKKMVNDVSLFDVSSWPSGIYIIRLSGAETAETFKVIKP